MTRLRGLGRGVGVGRRVRGASIEAMEARQMLAAAAAAPLAPPLSLLDPWSVPQFVNPLPNALDPSFIYAPADGAGGSPHYSVGAYPLADQDLGLGADPVTGTVRLTDVFAYGTSATTASYPGRTFVVRKGQPIDVTWVNGLPQQHVVPIDPTLLDSAHGAGGMHGEGLTFVPPDPAEADPRAGLIEQGIPAVPHLHGGHTDAVFDGTPLQYWTASGFMGRDHQDTTAWNGDRPANTFTYHNDQDATTLWYHDHAMGVTRLNAYAGMAGFYIIRDGRDTGSPDNPLGLPAGPYEIPVVIQDKQFLADGSLWFPAMASPEQANVASTLPEMFGDVVVVNGKAWPKLDVQPKRYRLRLLNGSDSRFYRMTIATPGNMNRAAVPIWQIGTDEGLLNAPVKLTQLTLGPGERADVIVDFTGLGPGRQFILTNDARSPFPDGARVTRGLTDRVMMFNVVASDGAADASRAPAAIDDLRGDDPIVPVTAATIPAADRQVALYETADELGRVTPLLGSPESSAVFIDGYEAIEPGATEVWEIYNNTADAHPIHLHLVKFQVLTRQKFNARVLPVPGTFNSLMMGPVRLAGKPAVAAGSELAYKDTVIVLPGEVVKIRATFDLPGRYVWHCHILSHEEHDMMRFFQVGDDPFPAPRGAEDQDGDATMTGAMGGHVALFGTRPVAPLDEEPRDVLA